MISRAIADRYFDNGNVKPCNLGGHLGFETKSLLIDGDLAEEVPSKCLVTCFHVGNVLTVQSIAQPGQGCIAESMNLGAILLVFGQIARTVDDRGSTVEDRLDHLHDVVGIVFEIRVGR